MKLSTLLIETHLSKLFISFLNKSYDVNVIKNRFFPDDDIKDLQIFNKKDTKRDYNSEINYTYVVDDFIKKLPNMSDDMVYKISKHDSEYEFKLYTEITMSVREHYGISYPNTVNTIIGYNYSFDKPTTFKVGDNIKKFGNIIKIEKPKFPLERNSNEWNLYFDTGRKSRVYRFI